MNSRLVSQGDSDGRQYTVWSGSIRSLGKKIPVFTQNIFQLGTGINKYKDLIVREPLPDIGTDLGIDSIVNEVGYVEAATRDRIPIESVRNDYRSHLFRGKMQGYKLVGHHQLLDDVLAELKEHPPLVRIDDIESLEATMYLSIYGARMYIEFLVPRYKRDSYILKVTCRNSVDKKYALTVNLFLHSEEVAQAEPDIPFDGFYHIHTRELEDGAIRSFMYNALHNFLYGTWKTDVVDFDDLEKIIRKNLTNKEQQLLLGILDGEKTERMNVLRFLEILSMLFEEGKDIFRNQERKLTKLAILTGELRKLTDEDETQQLFT